MEKILNENAIDVLDRMIAKNYKVDLIVTDPPYKVTTRGGYTNAGGMMLDEKMDIPGIGLYVSILDTEGTVVGMLQPSMQQ
jgi:DNA modification methylase